MASWDDWFCRSDWSGGHVLCQIWAHRLLQMIAQIKVLILVLLQKNGDSEGSQTKLSQGWPVWKYKSCDSLSQENQ